MQITTADQIVLTVHATMYIDWGLSISVPTELGRAEWYSPHALSRESVGFNNFDLDLDPKSLYVVLADEDEDAPWTQAEWVAYLTDDAEDLIDAYIGWEHWDEERKMFREIVMERGVRLIT